MFGRILFVSLFFSSLFSITAHAAGAEAFPLSATSSDEFRKQAQDLRGQMGAGGKYASLSQADQSRVGKQLDRLQEIYDKRAAGGTVNNNDQVSLVNASEEINAVLSGNVDDKLVCEQVRKLGSNRTQKVCLTVAQRKAQQDESRKLMQERRPLGTSGSGL